MRIRNHVITLVVAILGAVGLAAKQGFPSLASGISIFGCVGVALFYMMDAFWYHRFLIGAVKQAIWIESRHAKRLPELALSTCIGKASPLPVFGHKLHSAHRLHIFYILLLILLIVSAFLLPNLLSANESPKPSPPPSIHCAIERAWRCFVTHAS